MLELQERDIWTAIGHQGIGESNADCKRILDVCVWNNLAVMNTYYQHKEAHKWTWYRWNSIKRKYDKQSQIDLFLSSNKNRIRNVKAIPSVSLDSDHRLVLMTTKYRVQKCDPLWNRNMETFVMNSYRGAICWMHESLNVVTELTCRCHVERMYLVVSEYTGWVECIVFNVTYYTRKYDMVTAERSETKPQLRRKAWNGKMV